MNYIIRNKFITWLIALLILANIATLVSYWMRHFKSERDHAPREFLASRLKFSESQKNTYFELAKEHNEKAIKIREEIRINKDKLFQLLKSDTVNINERNQAALQVSASIQSLDILTFEHFKEVRALCTNEQKPRFDEIIQRMVNSVNNPQKGPPPPIK